MSELEETKTFTCMNCNSEIEIDTISGEALLIIKDLERQLAEANDELESYKCDNQVLIEIISDCLNKWNKYEAFEVLKEVNEYYKLKEKGE